MVETKKGRKFEVDGAHIAYEIFDRVDEIVTSNRERPHLRNFDALTKDDYRINWHGITRYEDAEKLALEGWKEVLEKPEFTNFYNANTGEEDKLFKFKNDVVGYAPIIPSVLKGLPQCMINVETRKVKAKVIHIIYNISCTSNYSSEQIMNAGLKVMSAIVDLEKQGFRVRLTAMQDFSKHRESDMMFINLKAENKKLDLYSCMFPFMHVAMFRVLGFAWHERSPVCRDFGMGYGTNYENACSNRESLIDNLKIIFKDKNVKYITSRDIMDNKSRTIKDIETHLLS